MDARLTDRLQQRLIEQLGVQSRYAVALPFEFVAQHAEGVVLAVGPDMRRARQPAQRLLVIGFGQHVHALEPLQLQRAQLVDAGLLDRLQRKGLVGHEEAPAGSGITVPLICVLLPRNSATAWPFWLLTRMS